MVFFDPRVDPRVESLVFYVKLCLIEEVRLRRSVAARLPGSRLKSACVAAGPIPLRLTGTRKCGLRGDQEVRFPREKLSGFKSIP
jgi:hypothetical protein